MKHFKALALAATALAAAAAADATTVNIDFSLGTTSVGSGTFTFATGTTGVVGYGDLEAFSFTVAGVSYDLAQMLALTNYNYFRYDIAANTLLPNPALSGNDGTFGSYFSALNDGRNAGYFFSTQGSYGEYSTGRTGSFDTITLDNDPGAVPEPATWAMMVGGFGLVGGMLRRRSLRVSFG